MFVLLFLGNQRNFRDLVMISLFAPVSALFLTVAFLMMGHGLQTTIIPIRAELEMFSSEAIGVITSFYYIGFVVGGLVAPYVIMRAGHIRAFAAMISLGSAAALVHPLFAETFTWAIARGITGFCVACTYLVIESWLNERATNETRGLVMSTYTIIVYLGIMVGQFSTSLIDISGFHAFVLSSIALSFAVIPIALTKSAQPAPIAVVKFRPLTLYQTSPAAISACILVGVCVGALFSLLPLFAARIDIEASLIPFFAGALMLGGLITQYPLGRLSDFIDRRYLLVAGSIGSIIVSLLMTFMDLSNMYLLFGGIALLGGLVQPLYAIAAAHAYDHTSPEDTVETASGILLSYGLGSIFGPTIASVLMAHYGPSALFLLVAIALTILTVVLLLRISQREALSSDDKTDYDLASTAPVGGLIAPELYESEGDYVLVPEEYQPTDNKKATLTGNPRSN